MARATHKNIWMTRTRMGERVTQQPNEPNTGEPSQFPSRQPQPDPVGPIPPQPNTPPQYGTPHYTAPFAATHASDGPAATSASGHFSRLAPVTWWTGVAAGAGAYLATLLVAVVVTLLAVVGLALAGSGESVDVPSNPFISSGDLPSPWAILLQFAAQLPALGMLGSLAGDVSVNAGVFGSIHATVGIFVVPLLVSAVILVALYWANRLAEKLAPSASFLQRVVQATVAGVVFSLLLNGVATIASISIAVPDSGGIRLDAADAASIIVAFLVGASVSLAGRKPLLLKTSGSARAAYARSLVRDAGLTVVAHLGTFLVIAIPVVVVVAGVKGGWGASLSSPLWAPTAGLVVFGLSHFAPFGYDAGGAVGGGLGSAARSEYGYAFGGMLADGGVPAWSGWLMVLLALVAVCTAATYWHLRRGSRNRTTILDWAYLPVAFLVAGSLVTWLAGVGATGGAGSLASGRYHAGLAWWTPLLMLIWGGVTEVVSRFLAPTLAAVLPAGAVAFIQKSPSTLAFPGQETPGATGGIPAAQEVARSGALEPGVFGQPAEVPAPPAVAPRVPMTKKARRKLAVMGGAAGLVLVLVVGGVIAVNVVRGAHGPDKVVSAYLDALVAGDAQKALEIGDPSIPTDQRALLSNAVYAKAADRPDGYAIMATKITDKTAVVVAELRQNGTKAPLTFKLAQKDPGILDPHWGMENAPLLQLGIATGGSSDVAMVNGARVKLGGETRGDSGRLTTLPAFPGTYRIELLTSSKYLSAAPATVTVRLGAQAPPEPAQLVPEPNEAFAGAVQDQVDALLTRCAAEKVIAPNGCPFRSYAFGDVRNVVWKVTKAPAFRTYSYGGSSWMLSSEDAGTASATYERDESFGSDKPDWQKSTDDVSIYLNGEITLDGDTLTVSFNN